MKMHLVIICVGKYFQNAKKGLRSTIKCYFSKNTSDESSCFTTKEICKNFDSWTPGFIIFHLLKILNDALVFHPQGRTPALVSFCAIFLICFPGVSRKYFFFKWRNPRKKFKYELNISLATPTTMSNLTNCNLTDISFKFLGVKR